MQLVNQSRSILLAITVALLGCQTTDTANVENSANSVDHYRKNSKHNVPGIASVKIPEHLKLTPSQLFDRYARCDIPKGESFESQIVEYKFRQAMYEHFIKDTHGSFIPKNTDTKLTVFGQLVNKVKNSFGMSPAVMFYIDTSNKKSARSFDALTKTFKSHIKGAVVCEGTSSETAMQVCSRDWGNGNTSIIMQTNELPDTVLIGCVFPYQI